MPPVLRVAACHAAPIFLSARATTAKCITLIKEAVTAAKPNLVVFPESFVPGFPVWSALRPPTENHDLFKRMSKESIYLDDRGEELNALRATAKQHNVMLSIGVSEKVRYSSATLFNSNVLIGSDGELLIHHRKLMPTFFEKLTWVPGDGHGLRVADTKFGKIGNLICGENTNPLARYALMAQGEQVHISTWPAVWPTRVVTGSTSTIVPAVSELSNPVIAVESTSARSSATRGVNYDNVAANRTRAAAHCFEAKCFGVLNSAFLDRHAIEKIAAGAKDAELVVSALERSPRGATMFLDPTGTLLPGFTVNAAGTRQQVDFLQNEEGILYADLDMDECVEGKQYHDVVGGYQRLDVFQLKVNRTRRSPATFEGDRNGLDEIEPV